MKNFLHYLMALAVCAVSAVSVSASPALPLPITVSQPDGTVLTIQTLGDEHQHWTQTADGVLLAERDGAWYVADIADDGLLLPTALLAHDSGARSAAESAAANRQSARRSLFFNRGTAVRRAAAAISGTGGYLPHEGQPRVLVALVEYQDLKFTVNEPLKAFTQYLKGDSQEDLGNNNQKNLTSICQYFKTVSGGKFLPQFDVVGPITLPQTMAYYGAGASNSEKMSQMCQDVCDIVKSDVDLSVYDNDGNGRVELLYVIFAGYGQNQGGSTDAMWAKVSTVNKKITDNLTVSRFGCGSELFFPSMGSDINGTGVFIHEFSHALGLPDLYSTSEAGRKVNNQGMERWSIMDYGLYNGNSYRPAAYTAWEREVMGWSAIEPLTESQQLSGVLPVLETGGRAFKIVNPQDDKEFIVLENIQKRGLNVNSPGHGLLAYHVAYPYTTVNMTDSPNSTAGKPSVAVVPADGLLISNYLTVSFKDTYGGEYETSEWTASLAGDPFPGTSNQTSLSDASALPNFLFYTGQSAVGASLTDIAEDTSTGTVSFTFTPSADVTGISTTLVSPGGTTAGLTVHNLSGQRVTSPTAKGIYIIGGRKVVVK